MTTVEIQYGKIFGVFWLNVGGLFATRSWVRMAGHNPKILAPIITAAYVFFIFFMYNNYKFDAQIFACIVLTTIYNIIISHFLLSKSSKK